ncbi:hypothetical protein THAOC_24540 [Thalassiosira oceanica]|uniref:Polysaccharide biosynthesis protein C-terminal domain-containing protein n=1 Tax=Thalassiosira oceanica TaxID=159749 RepID=K0RTN5_THAOC|nr:hypothetical protein THAOC_24540 [Thalassiosira oceanica]|eukprot:EJK55699.1 hypothetical protein THAOC_24540 [Thalassiosira oceanica]
MDDDRETQKIHHETSPLVGDVVPKKGADGAGEADSQDREATFKDDVLDTLHLAGPIFVSRVSWVGMKSTDTALLGHTSGDALSAAALSDLYTMCTAVLIQGRVLGILVGQTCGADNRHLAVVYLRISVAVLSALAVPVAISWAYTEDVWTWMGQPGDVAGMAGYYSRVFILAIPAQMIYSQLSQYLTAQRVMRPEVVTSSAGLAANLVLGLVLVLGWPIPGFVGFGFAACPIVTVVVVYIQLCILGYYFVKTEHAKPPIEGTLANDNTLSHWTSGFTWTRFQTFSQLYFPAALALSSDFWRMGLIGAIAAKIGEREVGLFNASYSSVSGATGIKLGLRLGKNQAKQARQAAEVGVVLCVVLLVLLSGIVYCNIRSFGAIFTSDESYLDLFEEVRFPFTCVLFFMNLSVGIERIPMSLGRTGDVFWAGFVASWFGQVPAVFFLVEYWRNDLYALYTGIGIGYAFLTILYSWMAYSSDFEHYCELAQIRAEAK